MCGLAFSGKSTLARKITEYTKSKLIAFDRLWVEKIKNQSVPKGDEGWRFIRKVAQDEITKALQEGVSVVYDDNNAKREHRGELRSVAEEAGSESVVIYLDTPLEIIRNREEANKTSQDRHEVEPENFQKVLGDLEVPTSDENTVVFKPETKIEDFLPLI